MSGFKGVFAEKGARFHGKWGLGAPSPPPSKFPVHTLAPAAPSPGRPPPPPGIFSKTPTAPQEKGGGAGPGAGGVGVGGAEAPFTAKTSPFFGENAFLVGNCTTTRCSVAAPPPGARHGFGGPMHPRHPRAMAERGATGAFGGGVAATPLLHIQNCGMSRDRGVATQWSAIGGGCSVCPTKALTGVTGQSFMCQGFYVPFKRFLEGADQQLSNSVHKILPRRFGAAILLPRG